MATYRELVNEASKQFEANGQDGQLALLYMLELYQKESYDYYLNNQNEADQEFIDIYKTGIKRLLNEEPLNYVLGYSWFYGYKFIVNNNVLIPRPETEELVANVLAEIDEHFSDLSEVVCADIGTGSGAIAIALAKEESKLKMYASDISYDALEVAKINAQNNEVKINFLQGSMCDPLVDNNIKLDFLVCNPPYIRKDAVLERSVVDFEPHVALFGEEDGLYFYRLVFEKAKLVLNQKAIMAFEIGYDQKDSLIELAKKYFPNNKIEVLKDINGKDRMLFIYIL